MAFIVDITDRKRAEREKLEMERRLLHAQKLESLGNLAGGIAHDFNNILAGIMGYADLSLVELPASEPVRDNIEIIKKSVRRAADLTRQMLAYSGRGKFIVEAVNLSQVVKDVRKMLEMSISKKATLSMDPAPRLCVEEAGGPGDSVLPPNGPVRPRWNSVREGGWREQHRPARVTYGSSRR